MFKKVVYLAGTAVAVGIAYFKGISHGRQLANSLSSDFNEDQDELDTSDEFEEPTDEDIVEAVERESEVPCEDSDCDETFDTEHGMKIHYGIAHNDDETEAE